MIHGSLSSGIGGFDIGAEANGIKTKWTCEIDPHKRNVLQWLFPKAKHFHDIRKIKRAPYVDIISFGFPCQDISAANPQGEGLHGNKSSLFFKGWEIIRICRPRIIVFENSPILVHKGLSTILCLLAKEGYDAEWDIISCKQFGLPSNRERLFIVAHSDGVRRKIPSLFSKSKINQDSKQQIQAIFQKWICSFPDAQRLDSITSWGPVISEFGSLDDGIPKDFLPRFFEMAGDTVSPLITTWIFSKIKEAYQAN